MLAAQRLAFATARSARTSIAASTSPAILRQNVLRLPVRRIHTTTILRSDEIPRTTQGIPDELKKEAEQSEIAQAVEEVSAAAESATVSETSATPEATAESTTNAAEAEKPEGEEMVPWFLRMKNLPKAPQHKAPEAQPVVFPEDAPVELEQTTTQLTEELGVTDIKIIDLRPLDPPPAIGMNTIMVVGTARSIKHLHAVADKICRWMRSTYKWSPYADGLLGRNELRLINRRKRRRGKVVASQVGQVEEAGSSAWVCVHSGKGIVIQLFTNAKREEVQIEALWEGALRRNRRALEREELAMKEMQEKEKTEEELEHVVQTSHDRFEEVEDGQVGPAEDLLGVDEAAEKEAAERAKRQEEDLLKELEGLAHGSSMPSVSGPRIQTRSFHSTRIVRENSTTASSYPAPPSHETSSDIQPSQPAQKSWSGPVEEPEPIDVSQRPKRAIPEDVIYQFNCPQIIQHLIYCLPAQTIQSLAPQGLGIIGNGLTDKDSTPWLRAFYLDLPNHPQELRHKYMLQYLTLSNTLNPKLFPLTSVFTYLSQHPSTLRLEHYFLVQKHIASIRPADGVNAQYDFPKRLKIIESINNNMRETLGDQAVDTYLDSPEYRYILFSARVPKAVPELRLILETTNLNSTRRRRLSRDNFPTEINGVHLWNWLELVDPLTHAKEGHTTYTLREHNLEWFICAALTGAWPKLFERWYRLNVFNVHRDSTYYRVILGLVLCFADHRTTLKAARSITTENMLREAPPVKLSNDIDLARNYLRVLEKCRRLDGTIEFDKEIAKAVDVVQELEGDWRRKRQIRELGNRRTYVWKPEAKTGNVEKVEAEREEREKVLAKGALKPWRRWEPPARVMRKVARETTEGRSLKEKLEERRSEGRVEEGRVPKKIGEGSGFTIRKVTQKAKEEEKTD